MITKLGSMSPRCIRSSSGRIYRWTWHCPVLIVSALIHDSAHREFVHQATVDADNRDGSTLLQAMMASRRAMGTVAFQHQGLFDAVVGVHGRMAVGLQSHCVDAGVRPRPPVISFSGFEHVRFFVIDRLGGAGLLASHSADGSRSGRSR